MDLTQKIDIKAIRLDSIAESVVMLIVIIIGFLPLGLLLSSSNSGFDLTDEGSYLNWMSNPWPYKVSDTQFGYIYYPVFWLLAGNVSVLRQVNILITTLLAFAVCIALIQKVWPKRTSTSRITEQRLVGLAFALSVSCLVYIPWGLVTPNYNSLALQSLLVAALGIVLAKSEVSPMSIIGWVLVGVGGWLALMAKPTTAVALSMIAGLYLLSTKFRLHLLSLSAATAVLLVIMSAYGIDGSITGFVNRLVTVAQEETIIGPINYLDMLYRGSLSLTVQEVVASSVFIFALSLAIFMGLSERTPPKIGWAMLTITMALGGPLLCVLFYSGAGDFAITGNQLEQVWGFRGFLFAAAIPIGTGLGCIPAIRSGLMKSQMLTNFALALCFATFPYAFALGTTNNYWMTMGAAGFFWVLVAVIILGSLSKDPINLRSLAALAAGAELVTIALVLVSLEYPYRQPQPLRLNEDLITLKPTGASLVVASSFSDYIKALQKLSYDNGFRIGDPMIDLTGASPGALFALGARSIGYPWLNGGYQSSANFAAARLDQVPCEELSQAWLLIEPSGPRKLPDDLLKRYGIDITTDFKAVGVLSPPSGWQLGNLRQDQQLLKPARAPEAALEHCQQTELTRHPG
jgi:hypothetical protein